MLEESTASALRPITVPPELRGAVVALGNFDGFHKGHQAVVGLAGRLARTAGAPLAVLTFDPHPARFFRPDVPPFMLTSAGQKVHLLRDFGVELPLVLPFSAAVAQLSPAAFVADVLQGLVGARHVVCGYDFTFGHNRAGKASDLGALGMPATVVSAVSAAGQPPYSSTAVRTALTAGRPDEAAAQLGRWWQIEAVVEHGDARGRTIGFPTANLSLGDYQRPAYGVYAVRVQLGSDLYDGVANIGLRPTFDPPRELVEVHLFDFSGDLYGRTVAMDLIAFIRGERRFSGLDALKAQIAADRATADKILRQPAMAAGRHRPATRADFEG